MTQNQVSLEKKATRMEKAATSNAAVLNRNTKEIDREKSEKKRDATPFIFLPPCFEHTFFWQRVTFFLKAAF